MKRGSKEGKNGALHLVGSLIKTSDETVYQILKNKGEFRYDIQKNIFKIYLKKIKNLVVLLVIIFLGGIFFMIFL